MKYQIKAYGADGHEIEGNLEGQCQYDVNDGAYDKNHQYARLMLKENQRTLSHVAYWDVSFNNNRLRLIANPFGAGISFIEAVQSALSKELRENEVVAIGTNKEQNHVVMFNTELEPPPLFMNSGIEIVGLFKSRQAVEGVTDKYVGWHAFSDDAFYSTRFVREAAKQINCDLQIGVTINDLDANMGRYTAAMMRVLEAQHNHAGIDTLTKISRQEFSGHEDVPIHIQKFLQNLVQNKNPSPLDWQRMAVELEGRVSLAIQAQLDNMSWAVPQILTGEINAEKYEESKNATEILTHAHIENSMGM